MGSKRPGGAKVSIDLIDHERLQNMMILDNCWYNFLFKKYKNKSTVVAI